MFETPEDMWSHYAWSCPITHMYRMQYGFTDAQLLYAARNMRNPYLASAVFPDPRRMLPPPAVSMSFGWYIAPWAGSSEALFSGSCFGDGSVAHGSSINASRAGWSVVMLSCHYLPALVEKAAWGGLPHAVQDIQGAELYAVLHWLTHLDPAGVFHTFYTDSAWVYDGWHQMDQMCLPSSAYCDLWVRVRTAAEEMPSATLQKTKAHLSETAVLGNPQREYERIGNKFADEYAREKGRADVMGDAAFACRVDRMRSMSFLVGKYYSRLLVWASKRDLLPSFADPERRRRLLRCTVHRVATDPGGQSRCVLCFKLSSELAAQQTQECSGAANGRPHRVMQLGAGMFCAVCGGYSFARTLKLSTVCKGTPRTPTMKRRLSLLQNGRHPIHNTWIGEPVPIQDAFVSFMVGL